MTVIAGPTTTHDPPVRGRGAGSRWAERYRPWSGRATAADWILMGAFAGVVALGLVIRPLKPFLLASHPMALELLTGDLLPIGAAAAYARIGEAPLWGVVLAGAVGMVKFDWLTWWAGRQWGEGMIRMVGATPERAQRYADRAATLHPLVFSLAVVAAFLPGVPGPIIFAMAGIAGMRLITFLVLDLFGALMLTGLVAGLGYRLGQDAVDMVLLIDRYATWVSLTVISTAVLVPWARRLLRNRRSAPATPPRPPATVRSRGPWTQAEQATPRSPAARRGLDPSPTDARGSSGISTAIRPAADHDLDELIATETSAGQCSRSATPDDSPVVAGE